MGAQKKNLSSVSISISPSYIVVKVLLFMLWYQFITNLNSTLSKKLLSNNCKSLYRFEKINFIQLWIKLDINHTLYTCHCTVDQQNTVQWVYWEYWPLAGLHFRARNKCRKCCQKSICTNWKVKVTKLWY